MPRVVAPGAADDERQARVVWIGVAPGNRRRGLGSRLLDAALLELHDRGATRVSLSVDGTEVEALGLFRKAGFAVEGQDLGLLLGAADVARLAAQTDLSTAATVRPLALDDVPLLAGLLIHLGLERAAAPHDALEALTPAQVEQWLQRPATVAFAAWERGDPQTPLGLAWATRRREDGVLRFIGVEDDHRRQGIGTALLASLAQELGPARTPAPGAGGVEARGTHRPLRAPLNEPGDEQGFFRALGFVVERVTYRMARALR
jgi:ribosomal protein S18 acetylase RimI-like enzyme